MSEPEDDASDRTTLVTREQLAEAMRLQDDTAHYVVTSGDGPARRVEVVAGAAVTVGRDSQKVLSFNDVDLSRFHLQVSLVRGKAVVEDMGSTNGTYVNGQRIDAPTPLREGDVVSAGRQVLTYERRSRRDVERAEALERDLRVANGYVHALLPEPLTTGAIRTAWRFVPSLQLGGDAFGYRWLDGQTFVFYLIDVSGHGAGPAMHSVTVMNLLRQQALPGVDFTDPAAVLRSLNARFQMEHHGGLFFTMWYGVYRTGTRMLRFGSAGHHPAYLVPPDTSSAQPLVTEAVMIGAMDDAVFLAQEAVVPPGSAVYLFSDGAYEIDTKDGGMWGLKDFVPLLLAPPQPGTTDPERLYQTVVAASAQVPLADDFSMVKLTFT